MSQWCHGGKERRFQEGVVSCVSCYHEAEFKERRVSAMGVSEKNGHEPVRGMPGQWAALPPTKGWAQAGRSPSPPELISWSPGIELTW